MPHVMWELQGNRERQPVFEEREEHEVKVSSRAGSRSRQAAMTPLQYDQAMGDLVGYLQWMAEPAQNTRLRVGVWVLLFLCYLYRGVAPQCRFLERRQVIF
jgi:ubiquinol-cytochrome c reductase cytochrome c1 subunit